MAVRKAAQPGNEPFGGKGRCHADRQMRRLWPQQAGCLIDHRQGVANAAAVAQPRIGQCQAPGQALEQTKVQARFQPAYLLCNCRLGHPQLVGGQAKVQVAGNHFEHT
ncbi:hypothetical protein D3C71_1763690 [compost metagenome]